ncbi:MAG: dynamin family protein [Alphaproteobacteria bacterium]|nr:dynamin family protein [Alphaproteobacteria bacterium]
MTEAMQILIGLLAETRRDLKQMAPSAQPDLREILDAALRRLERSLHRRPTVVISGESNSGKTSVANMLAGMEVLPAAVVSNTTVPVLLRHGTAPTVSAVTADGRKPLAVATTEALPKFLYSDLDCVEVDLPSMRDHGFEILDTPSSAPASDLIERADVLIWCSLAARPWTESERQTVAHLPSRLRKRSLLVITHKDSLAPAERGRVFARYEEMAGAYFSQILMVDATADRVSRDASKAMPTAPQPGKQSDAARLKEHLDEVLQQFWDHRAMTGRRLCRHLSHTLAAALPPDASGAGPRLVSSTRHGPPDTTFSQIAEQLSEF